MKKTNLKGLTFSDLTVISPYKKPNQKRTFWLCKCFCGKTTIVSTSDLTTGHTKSCGCKKTKNKGITNRKTVKNNRLYNIWRGMKKRCYLPSDKSYHYYGGRDITICDEWKDNFLNFYEWAINNGYNDSLTIDRKNNNGNYEPSNCRWVDIKTQERNKSNNLLITGTKSLSEWCEILNYPYKKAKNRCQTLRRSNKPITFDSVFDL